MPIFSLFYLGCAGLFVSAAGYAQEVKTSTGTMLLFMEKEKNIDAYPSRFIVADDFLRIDDGENSIDFVLFDKKNRRIYSVSGENRNIMVVEEQHSDVESPIKLEIENRSVGKMQGAPKIEGVTPHHYQFVVNGKVCYEYAALTGVMTKEVEMMREFSKLLASDSKLTVGSIPGDMQDACSLAAHTFAPGYSLSQGFPLQEWNKDQYSRALVDYKKDFVITPELFALPEGYAQQTVQQIRGAK